MHQVLSPAKPVSILPYIGLSAVKSSVVTLRAQHLGAGGGAARGGGARAGRDAALHAAVRRRRAPACHTVRRYPSARVYPHRDRDYPRAGDIDRFKSLVSLCARKRGSERWTLTTFIDRLQ